MSNFAKIDFIPINRDDCAVYYNERMSFLFDVDPETELIEIVGFANTANDFGSNRYFKTTESDSWYDWAPNYVNLINTYYAGTLGYKIEAILDSNKITIRATEFGHNFALNYYDSDPQGIYTMTVGTIFNPEFGLITPEFEDPNITITEITAEQAASSRELRCKFKIKAVEFTAPNHIVNLPYGGSEIPFVDPYCYLDYYRNVANATVQLMDGAGKLSQIVALPSVTEWKIDNIITSGSTATIVAIKIISGVIDTSLTYSIDGNTFQNSNNFAGLATGDYTAYILDTLGGIWTKTFSIVNLENIPEPFIDMSDVNSLQFRDSAQIGNHLSLFAKQKFINQENVCFKQLFRDDNIIKLQIRSSYANIYPSIGDINYTVTKIVDNIGIEDWRDCQFADGGSGKTLVYFSTGNVYNPSNGQIVSTYNTNSIVGIQLETWQKEGVILNLTFGSFVVTETIYSNVVGGMCLVINANFLSFVSEICKSVYNKEDWDVYEFTVDMGLLNKSITHECAIIFSDANYPTKVWESEPFNVVEDENNELLKLEVYGNAVISDMVATGIVHTLYLEATFIPSDPFQDVEAMNSDIYDSIKIRSSYDKGFTLSTHAIAPYLIDKINLFLLYDNIFIDGLKFEIDKESKIEFLSDKRNPLAILKRSFRANKTANSNKIGKVTSRVLGASSITVLGA